MYEAIMTMILIIAAEVGIPQNFALAIALEENWTLNPSARGSPNSNGTIDLGVMQLNSQYFGHIDWEDPEINIRTGCLLIKELHKKGLNWWQVAVAYNCGYGRLTSQRGPPIESVNYAERVFRRWDQLEKERIARVFLEWEEFYRHWRTTGYAK